MVEITALLLLASGLAPWILLPAKPSPPPTTFDEQCPLRFELDVSSSVARTQPGERIVRGVPNPNCKGLTLAELHVFSHPGIWSPVKKEILPGDGVVLTIETHVNVPPGEDQELTVHASLLREAELLVEGRETIEGEEGDVNWDDGVVLPLRAEQARGTVLLHLEVDGNGIDP